MESSIDIPELTRRSRAILDRPRPNVTISEGPLGASASGPGRGLFIDGGRALFEVPGVARYSVEDGSNIIVDAGADAPPRSVRLFLLGTVLALLCFQRGLFPLHANSIVANGAAVAFAGRSGVGKSTLAAWFQRAGYDVLGDDLCVLSLDDGDTPIAKRGLPRLRLWQDSAAAMGQDCSQLEHAFEGLEKYHIPITRTEPEHSFPLRRIYLLQPHDGGDSSAITRLNGMAAFGAIAMQTYRGDYLDPMGLRQRHFEQCAKLLRHVEVYSAPCQRGFDRLDQEAAKFEQHFRDA